MSYVEPKIIRKKSKALPGSSTTATWKQSEPIISYKQIPNMMYGEYNYLGHENTVYRFKTIENFQHEKVRPSKATQCMPIGHDYYLGVESTREEVANSATHYLHRTSADGLPVNTLMLYIVTLRPNIATRLPHAIYNLKDSVVEWHFMEVTEPFEWFTKHIGLIDLLLAKEATDKAEYFIIAGGEMYIENDQTVFFNNESGSLAGMEAINRRVLENQFGSVFYNNAPEVLQTPFGSMFVSQLKHSPIVGTRINSYSVEFLPQFVARFIFNAVSSIVFDSRLKERVLPTPATPEQRFSFLKQRCDLEQKQQQSIGQRVRAFPRRSFLYTSDMDCRLDKREYDTVKEWEQHWQYNTTRYGPESSLTLQHQIISNRKPVCNTLNSIQH